MKLEENKMVVRDFMELAFNQGNLSVIAEHVAPDAVDHQEPPGTDFIAHLKQVIPAMRTAFPDLHFEIHHMVAEGDIVAFRSTMTGTHRGLLKLGNMPPVPPTGQKVAVSHMHFVRIVNGKSYDLWHVWDTAGLMRQLGVMPERQV